VCHIQGDAKFHDFQIAAQIPNLLCGVVFSGLELSYVWQNVNKFINICQILSFENATLQPMIFAQNLSKHFAVRKRASGLLQSFVAGNTTIKAVDNISFTISKGEIVGYLGPNGAGKSTTLKMLTGLLVPTLGRLEVGGLVPHQNRVRYVAKIGAVFGQRSNLWWDLPVVESFELLQHIYKIPAAKFKSNLERLKNLLGLDEFLSSPARSLSLGQRMRADLCAALLHDPEILFLDEPTIGLDVVAKERIREFIRQINLERQTTVILTTHDMADVQKLCERVLMIDHGRLLFDGALQSLQNQFGGLRRLVVDFETAPTSLAFHGATIISQQGVRVVLELAAHVRLADLIAALTQAHAVRDLSVQEPEIEATIRRIYEGGLLV
jgi:ABC-2 type transport system ATP-binding protein